MVDSELNIKINTSTDISDLEDLKSLLEEILANAKTTGQEGGESLNEIGLSAEDVANTLESTSDSVNNLGSELDTVSGQGLEDVSSSSESTSKSLDDVSSSSQGASQGLDDVASSSENASKGMDDASNSADDLSKGMGVMEGSMLLSASEQVKGIGDSAESMSQDLDNAQITMGQLAIQTGITEAALTSMINNISNETFPREEAMQYVKALDQAHVSTENLGTSATAMDRINDALHLGADRTTGLSMELSVLGVDLNNVESAYNALAYANANTLGGMDNYYTFLKKYDAQFKELGFNVDQASVIIAGATQKYGAGRAALTGLSDALKESNGDTRALEEALDLEAGSLENASQITGQYQGQLEQMAQEELEHKTITERLGAAWEDFSMTLAPILSPLGSILGLLGQVGSFAMGANGIITLAETFGLLDSAMLATIPSQIAEGVAGWFAIGWIAWAVVIILAVIAVLVYLYYTNEDVANAINSFGQAIMQFGGLLYNYLLVALQVLWSYLLQLWNIVNMVMAGLVNAVNSGNGNIIASIMNVVAYLLTLPIRLAAIFANMIAKALGFGNNFTGRMYSAAVSSVSRFISQISQLPSQLLAELNQMLSYVTTWAATLPEKFWQAGVDAVKNFLSALGIASPGTMQRMLIWEVQEMGRRLPVESLPLLRNVSALGSDIVDEFGNPQLSVGSEFDANLLNSNLNIDLNGLIQSNKDNKGIIQPTIILNIDSVDKRERVDEIVEAVTKALAWSNTTAGRTV